MMPRLSADREDTRARSFGNFQSKTKTFNLQKLMMRLKLRFPSRSSKLRVFISRTWQVTEEAVRISMSSDGDRAVTFLIF